MREAALMVNPPVTYFTVAKSFSRRYEIHRDGAWVATLQLGRRWRPTTVELIGDRWEVRAGKLLGLATTVTRYGTGELIARRGFRQVEIVGRPSIRWRPRGFTRHASFVREDGAVVAEFAYRGSSMVVAAGSGDPFVDMLAIILGWFGIVRAQKANSNLPPSVTG